MEHGLLKFVYLRVRIVQDFLSGRRRIHPGSKLHDVKTDRVPDSVLVTSHPVDGRVKQRLVSEPTNLQKETIHSFTPFRNWHVDLLSSATRDVPCNSGAANYGGNKLPGLIGFPFRYSISDKLFGYLGNSVEYNRMVFLPVSWSTNTVYSFQESILHCAKSVFIMAEESSK